MTRKTKRRSIVEIGKGPATVKIYTINRKDGYGPCYDAVNDLTRTLLRHLDFQTRIGLTGVNDSVIADDQIYESVAALVAVETRPFEHVGNEVLHDGTENGRAPIFALTAFRFVEDASKAGFEGRTGINFELERRRLKVVTNPLYPPRLNHFQIKALPLRRFIQKDCILLHVSHAATTGGP